MTANRLEAKGKKMLVVVGLLTLAALVSFSHLQGQAPGNRPGALPLPGEVKQEASKEDTEAKLAQSRLAQKPLLTYRPLQGDPLFALQLQPELPRRPRRPRDIAFLVSTSASLAGAPWNAARQLVEALTKKAEPQDRISLWTVSTPDKKFTRNLTAGWQSPRDDAQKLQAALKELEQRQYPAGDADLPNALTGAIDSFDEPDRQRIIVYLGDGQSFQNPITGPARNELCQRMVRQKIAFFSVPLGKRFEAANLHGLATGTGGTVIRVQIFEEKVEDVVRRAEEAFAGPILYPTRFTMSEGVVEHFPTQLPPLRSDSPTLILGTYKEVKTLGCTVQGVVDGQTVHRTVNLALPEHEDDNYFLVSMAQQWRNARDQHALIRADRALAFAFERTRLQHQELLLEAQMALHKKEYDAAARLYRDALVLNAHDIEAKSGLKLVEELRTGKVKWEQLQQQLEKAGKRQGDLVKKQGGQIRLNRVDLLALAQAGDPKADPKADFKADPKAQPGQDIDVMLQRHRDQALIEEQRVTQTVEAALRQYRRDLNTDPEKAHEALRNTLLQVQNHPDLANKVRDNLTRQLQAALRDVAERGKVILAHKAEQQVLKDIVKKKFEEEARLKAELDLTESRITAFKALMNKARYEERAMRDIVEGMMAIQKEARINGTPIPLASQHLYDAAQARFNLQKLADLRQVREQRFLQIMMEIEKTHIPYPDEPPIHFPPLATWKVITEYRKEKYEVSTLPDDYEARKEAHAIQRILEDPIDLKDFQLPMKLKEALGLFYEKLAAKGKEVPILVDTEAFKAENPDAPDIYDTDVKFPPIKAKMALGAILRLALAQIPTQNATYVIRRSHIEITTNNRILEDKVLRIYPVGELVVPITQQGAFNQIFGGFGMQPFGGQFNFGMQFGGMQFQGTFPGGFNGNLGFMGATQAVPLIQLVTTLVAPGEWFVTPAQQAAQQAQGGFLAPGGFNAPGFMPQGGGPPIPVQQGGNANLQEANTIDFFAPTLALVVRAPSRIHYKVTGGIIGGKAKKIEGAGALDGNKDRILVQKDDKGQKKVVVANANDQDKDKPGIAKVKTQDKDGKQLDPRTIWQEGIAKSGGDPGLIIAVADFLFEHEEYEHAAEFLKANLRHGIIVRPWVYEALAIAMEMSGSGSPEEIRRARLSAISLDPQDADGFIRAAQAMAEHKEWSRAIAFCKQAALLEPNSPRVYNEALVYAELAKDSQALEWAASELLSQDWPVDSYLHHLRAQARVDALTRVLENEKRRDEAERLKATLARLKQRDLVIKLSWEPGDSGLADLELQVKEPNGSICSSQFRQTPGGGILLGNNLASLNRATYVASQAFSGDYEITVRRVWGQPLGGKFRLEIIAHQGTPKERRLPPLTLRMDGHKVVHTFTLEEGRRTEPAVVPPPEVQRPTTPETKEAHILSKLRALADPVYGAQPVVMRSGMAAPLALGRREVAQMPPPAKDLKTGSLAFQNAIPGAAYSGVGLTTRAEVSSDQRHLRLSVIPNFTTLPGLSGGRPNLDLPLIPGGR